jgi:hypothetical protein
VGPLKAVEAERAKRKLPSSLAAYECVLRGRSLPVVEPEAETRRLYEKAIELDPDDAKPMLYLPTCSPLSGGIRALDRAREHAADVLRRTPDFSLACLAAKEMFKRTEDTARLIEGMRAARLPE